MEYRSNYILRALRGDANIFTPNILKVDRSGVTFYKRNHFLINVDERFIPASSIASVMVNTGILGATLIVVSKGGNEISITGLSISDARRAKEEMLSYLET